jgi:hypothetical protein
LPHTVRAGRAGGAAFVLVLGARGFGVEVVELPIVMLVDEEPDDVAR